MNKKEREGYKKTEIGIIPEEWEVSYFKDICSIVNGQVDPTTEPYNQMPHIGNANIEKHTGRLLNYKTAEEEQLTSGKYLFNKSHVLYGKINPQFGKVAYPGFEGICSADMYPISSEKLIPKFLKYLLLEPRFTAYTTSASGRTGIPKVNRKDLEVYRLVVPPINEQDKIANILTSVDESMEKTKVIIEQTEKVKKGLMKQLLTKGIGHIKFKETEIGVIPEVWDCVPLSKVLKVQGGYAFKSKDSTESGIRWLKIANVGIGEVSWEDNSFLPIQFAQQHPEFLLESNDLVMAMTRPVIRNETKVARLDMIDVPSLLNQRVGRFQINEGINREFLFHFLRSRYFANEILLKIAGTDPPNVSGRQIESVLIALPGVEEQRKISDVLSFFDEKLKNEKNKLQQLDFVKMGLMQILLTGMKRVKVDNEEVTTS